MKNSGSNGGAKGRNWKEFSELNIWSDRHSLITIGYICLYGGWELSTGGVCCGFPQCPTVQHAESHSYSYSAAFCLFGGHSCVILVGFPPYFNLALLVWMNEFQNYANLCKQVWSYWTQKSYIGFYQQQTFLAQHWEGHNCDRIALTCAPTRNVHKLLIY